MIYYILPKIYSDNLILNPQENNNELKICVSESLLYHYNNIHKRIINTNELINFEELKNNLNLNEYIFSNDLFSKYNITSKFKSKTNIFYNFLEIITLLNIFDLYKHTNLNTLHFTKNNDTIECIRMVRKNYNDNFTYFDKIETDINEKEEYNFIFFDSELYKTDDCNNDKYYILLIKILIIILKNQELYGSCIIKINEMFYKPVIDFLYILSSMYEKIYIIKPNTSNITSYEKYIICTNFYTDESISNTYKNNFYNLLTFLKNKKEKIQSILDFKIPCFFLTKIHDINIIIGQQQLDTLDMIINLLKNKNKNKEEKIDLIKKNCMQKTIVCCEKNINYNNCLKKCENIFLTIK